MQLLVNNAGVVDGWKDLDEVTEADMLQCFKVNALGPLLVTQQLHRRGLLGGRGGTSVVANMTSKARRGRGAPPPDPFPACSQPALCATPAACGEGQCMAASMPCPAPVLPQMGSVADNGSGGSYAYRASKAALNIGVGPAAAAANGAGSLAATPRPTGAATSSTPHRPQ